MKAGVRYTFTLRGRRANRIPAGRAATFSISGIQFIVIAWRSVNFHPPSGRRNLSK
ncbi:MAG: hypothetical protein JO166_15670 [Deltaproteobacteria bacterium]|nr:hypothetical protein [Deltaproteobacteria bacterium]